MRQSGEDLKSLDLMPSLLKQLQALDNTIKQADYWPENEGACQ